MMMWCPIVTRLKRRKSAERRQGRPPFRPITRFSDIATMSESAIKSDRHRRLDVGMRIVIGQREVIVGELEDIGNPRVDLHFRQ